MGLLDNLLNEGKKYIRDAMPGGLLNPEIPTASQQASKVIANLDKRNKAVAGLLDNPTMEGYQSAMEMTGLAPLGLTVWHGSPHKFNKFDASRIGSEQGGKLFGGRGFSVADNPKDAMAYGENLYKVDIPDDLPIFDARNKASVVDTLGDLVSRYQGKPLKQLVSEYEAAKKATKIDAVHLDDLGNGFKGIQWKTNGEWVSPMNNRVSSLALSDDPSGMATALRMALPMNPMDGLSVSNFNPSEVTAALSKKGYGAAKIDGSIGHRGDEITVFDPEMMRILERNGQATGLEPWKPGEWQGLLGYEAPRAEAMRIAQQNAAKPVSEGGLGLRPDNTPMERATAMGFDTPAFHGTADDRLVRSRQFKDEMLGKSTRVDDARKGHFTASTGEAASEYTYRDGDMTGNVLPLLLRGDRNTHNIPGEWMPGAYDSALDAARAEGKDGITILGATTLGKPSDVQVTFDPKNIRSRFAAFDPARRMEADLLGQSDPRLLGAIAGGGLLGGYAYQDK